MRIPNQPLNFDFYCKYLLRKKIKSQTVHSTAKKAILAFSNVRFLFETHSKKTQKGLPTRFSTNQYQHQQDWRLRPLCHQTHGFLQPCISRINACISLKFWSSRFPILMSYISPLPSFQNRAITFFLFQILQIFNQTLSTIS